MADLLYLSPSYKKHLQDEIKKITDCFIERLFPNFQNIENETDEYSQKLFDNTCHNIGYENFDPADAAENAMEKGIEYYQTLSLAKYGFTAFSISLLYHFWEQQIIKFLYRELQKNDYEIDFKEFRNKTSNINDIKELLLFYNIKIEDFNSWNKLNELRLLNNAVKHGSTGSLLKLKDQNSNLFHEWLIKNNDAIEHVDSCILEEILNITENNFKEYAETLISFWDEFPIRSYNILDNEDINQ